MSELLAGMTMTKKNVNSGVFVGTSRVAQILSLVCLLIDISASGRTNPMKKHTLNFSPFLIVFIAKSRRGQNHLKVFFS